MWIAIASTFLAAQATASPPPPAPPCAAAEFRQLDFWVGDWDLSFDAGDRKTGRATNRITKDELGRCFVTEHFEQPDIGFIGLSHSTFDRRKKQWVQTWVDNQGGYINLVGGPVQGQPYSFELKTIEPRGPTGTHFRMIWQEVKPDSLVWRWQQQEADRSYKDTWVINYKRRK